MLCCRNARRGCGVWPDCDRKLGPERLRGLCLQGSDPLAPQVRDYITRPAAAGHEQDDPRAGTDHLRERHSEPHGGHEQILGEKLGSITLFQHAPLKAFVVAVASHLRIAVNSVDRRSPICSSSTGNVERRDAHDAVHDLLSPRRRTHYAHAFCFPFTHSLCRAQPGVLASRGTPDRRDAGKGPPAP